MSNVFQQRSNVKSDQTSQLMAKKQEDSLYGEKIQPRAGVWLDPSVLPYVSYSIPLGWKTIQKLEKKKTTSVTLAALF